MSRLYIIEQRMERTKADIVEGNKFCIFDNKKSLYTIPHLHDKYEKDVNLCGSCLIKYDKGQIKI